MIKTSRLKSLALLSSFLAAALAGPPLMADCGPKPAWMTGGYPSGLAVRGDMEGINVEMTAEQVDIDVKTERDRGVKKTDLVGIDWGAHPVVDVKVHFEMTNLGDADSFEVGFPVGFSKDGLENFSVRSNGAPVKCALKDFAVEKNKDKKPWMKTSDWWYVWDQSFAARAKTEITVEYRQYTYVSFYRESSGTYILHTGGPWKNPIGKAVVTLTMNDDYTIDHINSLSNLEQATFDRDNKRVVWTFENLEPTKDNDIGFTFDMEYRWCEQRDLAQRDANLWWTSKAKHARMYEDGEYPPDILGSMADKPTTDKRLCRHIHPGDFPKYVESLDMLVNDVTVWDDDGSVRLPKFDSEYAWYSRCFSGEQVGARIKDLPATVLRPYADDAEALLRFFAFVVRILEESPEPCKVWKTVVRNKVEVGEQCDGPDSRKIAKRWLTVVNAFLDGKLYAGDKLMAYKDTAQAAAKTDELRKLRDKAQSLLSANKSKQRGAEDAIPDLFKRVDANDDGKISKEEAARSGLFEKARIGMDVDKDGFVTLQEMCDYFEKSSATRSPTGSRKLMRMATARSVRKRPKWRLRRDKPHCPKR